MSDYLERIETWIEEVEDPEKDVSDYDFLDQLVHQGEDGNNGLANVGAYLAITEEEGEIKVDEGLLEELDERQAGTGYGGRNRFSNIVKEGDTKKRENNTLYDKEVDGHQFLREMIEDYRENGDLNSLPPDNENVLKVHTQNQTSNSSNGGDNNMVRQHDDPEDLGRQATDARHSQEEMYENLSDLETAVFDTLVEGYDMALDDAYDAVREAEHRVGDALEEQEDNYDTVAQFAEGLQEEIEDHIGSLDLDRFTDRAYDRFDTEMGTMERNRERFRNEHSEYF